MFDATKDHRRAGNTASHVLKRKVDNSRDGAVVLDLGRLLQHFQVDLITLAGTGEAWGNLLTEEDHYNYLEVGDGLLKFVQSCGLVPAST